MLKKANNKYHLYCLKNRIIADFSRIHPFNNTPLCLKKEFNVFLLDRKTVSVNTEITTENRWEIYPSKLRTILRKCKKELVLKKSKNIDSFIFLYEKTMQKNNADDFYYFGRSYFERLINIEGVELYEVLYEDRVISASFFLFGEELGHYHLSANDYEFRKHNANYYILDSVFDIAHKKGIKQFHLGGGRTNLNDDSLLKFKNKFSPLKKDFYIAGIIHNNDIYKKYCEIWENENQKEIKYFLKYRL